MDMTMTMPMSTPTPTGAMAMPSSSSSSMPMEMSSMSTTFFTSTTTPLWSSSFTPHTPSQYAGLCIFLIVFSAIFRVLLAVRVNLFAILEMLERRTHRGLVAARYDDRDAEGKRATMMVRPWRAKEAVITAVVDVVVAGVSYLLMLAVMTFNVGYFLSILGGVFLGSLFCGRLLGNSVAH